MLWGLPLVLVLAASTASGVEQTLDTALVAERRGDAIRVRLLATNKTGKEICFLPEKVAYSVRGKAWPKTGYEPYEEMQTWIAADGNAHVLDLNEQRDNVFFDTSEAEQSHPFPTP